MNNGVDLLFPEYPAQALRVPDIALIEREILSGQLPGAAKRFRLGVVVIIQNYNVIPVFGHFNRRMAANISAAACN